MKRPLRKIIGFEDVEIVPGVIARNEKLECGHIQPVREGVFGPTSAYRRRCDQCTKENDRGTEEEGLRGPEPGTSGGDLAQGRQGGPHEGCEPPVDK